MISLLDISSSFQEFGFTKRRPNSADERALERHDLRAASSACGPTNSSKWTSISVDTGAGEAPASFGVAGSESSSWVTRRGSWGGRGCAMGESEVSRTSARIGSPRPSQRWNTNVPSSNTDATTVASAASGAAKSSTNAPPLRLLSSSQQ